MLLPLVLLFVVVPIAELALVIQVGQAIGVWWTIGLLVIDSILGAVLMRTQGRSAWARFNDAARAGRVPAREVLDGGLIMFGGLLLLTPGFITDFLGLVLLVPPTRALVRAVLAKRLTQRIVVSMSAPRPRPDDVVDGTAVDIESDRLTPPGGAR